MNRIPFSVYDFFGYLATGFLMLVTVAYATCMTVLLRETPPLVMSFFWIVAAYVVGHIVAHIASAFLEEAVLRRGLGSPEEHLLAAKKSGWRARIFPGNFKPFPTSTQQRVLTKAQQRGVTTSDRSFFFHCHPLVKRDQATLERLNSFLNLYGFSRNLCMALLLIVPLLLYSTWGSECGFRRAPLWWAVIALVAAIGMFYRYLKFFRHYTVEVFTTYAELPYEGHPDQDAVRTASAAL